MARDALLLGLLEARGLPTVLHVHCHGYVEALRRAPRPLAEAVRRGLRRASAVVTLTEAEGVALAQAVPGAEVVVVPNGVDPEVARAAQAFDEKDPPSAYEPLRVLFLSNLMPFKGYATVLEAASAARRRGLPHHYTFAGALPDELTISETLQIEAPDPRSIVREQGLEGMVDLLGSVRGQAKLDLLAQSHVFVLPSRFEVQPLSILEAMHFGLPVVASRRGGIPEMLGRGPQAELLVEPDDPEGLLAALCRLQEDQAFYAEVSRALRDRARRLFDPAVHVRRMHELFVRAAS